MLYGHGLREQAAAQVLLQQRNKVFAFRHDVLAVVTAHGLDDTAPRQKEDGRRTDEIDGEIPQQEVEDE